MDSTAAEGVNTSLQNKECHTGISTGITIKLQAAFITMSGFKLHFKAPPESVPGLEFSGRGRCVPRKQCCIPGTHCSQVRSYIGPQRCLPGTQSTNSYNAVVFWHAV
eukprot:2678780-Lingulodinium_polyedra.AAC.2